MARSKAKSTGRSGPAREAKRARRTFTAELRLEAVQLMSLRPAPAVSVGRAKPMI
jgi:hypothetical protein